MKAGSVIALVVAGGLIAGCTTTSSGPSTANRNLDQAAVYNAQLALDALQKGNLADAKAKIERAVEQDARNAEVQATAGLIYDRLGDDRKAETHFSRAVAIDPQNPVILNNYAVFLCRKGDAERGQKYFLQAAENPVYRTPAGAYVNAGTCARNAGKAAEAEQHFRRALQMNPRNAEALIQLADLELTAGNLLPSRAFLERYLEVTPATSASLWLGVRLERATGNPKAAAAYAERLKSQFPTSVETRQLLDSERTPG